MTLTIRNPAPPPLIAHVVYHFDVGGLENGMVNLINRIPPERYRHAIICMRGFTDYRERIKNPNVQFFALDKKPGKDPAVYQRLYRLLQNLQADIIHTRNLSGLEGQFLAAACGIRARIHSEHGREGNDLDGRNTKYNLLRKLARPFIHRYIALSGDLQDWLVNMIGVSPNKIVQIYNGVDIKRFHPRSEEGTKLGPPGFTTGEEFIVGSVGRMAAVKDFPTLIQAFLETIASCPELRNKLRLVIVGDGPTRHSCQELIEQAGATDVIWLAGERADVPELMRQFDLFVLPSLGEGISNTILEAMASGVPVLATHVGGNPELIDIGVTGHLTPPNNAGLMAQSLLDYVTKPNLARCQGLAAREKVEERFSLDAMVSGYLGVYDEVLAASRRR
jgi:sugar transferase (PEP-CTERM/EpsH1 system associated)